MLFEIIREGKQRSLRDKVKAFSLKQAGCMGIKLDRMQAPAQVEGRGKVIWSSEYRSMADALELTGEEGRDKLRKAAGRSTYPVIRGCPNGVTRMK